MTRHSTLVVLTALVLAGCFQPLPEHPEEGTHARTPPSGEGVQNLDLEALAVTWQGDGNRSHDLTWDVPNATWVDGVFMIDAIGRSDEGWDFLFTLNYRVDGPHPVRLAYDASLARENTFNFTYREAPWWAGRVIDRVADVDEEASSVDVYTWERGTADVAGVFHLAFTGACDAECPPDEGNATVVLDGKFPKPRAH